jgi:hypothetical protein
VAGWDRAVTILLTEAVGVRAGMTTVSLGVAVPAVAVLGATSGEVANLVAGVAAHPGFEVSRAGGADMAHMATHGAKVVHVNDWGVEGCVGGYCSSGEARAREKLRSIVGEEGRTVSEEKVRAWHSSV